MTYRGPSGGDRWEGFPNRNPGWDHRVWATEREDENPFDFDPFSGGKAPFSPKRKAKPVAEPDGKPEVFHLDDVVTPDVTPSPEESEAPTSGEPPPPSGAAQRKDPTPPPRPAEPEENLPNDDDLPVAPEPKPKSEPPKPVKPRAVEDFPPVFIPENPDETLNPYEATPPAKPRGANPTEKLVAPVKPVIPDYAPPSPLLLAKEKVLDNLGLIVLVVGVFVLVVLGIVIAPFLSTGNFGNTPPVASIAEPASLRVVENQRITLDAGDSRDPEGEALRYEWRYTSGSGEEIIFSETDGRRLTRTGTYTTSNPQTRIQFIQPGSVTIFLRVHDGVHYSREVDLTFTVAPRAAD